MEAENSGPTFSFTDEETEAHTRPTWSSATWSVYGTTETNRWLVNEVFLLGTLPQFSPSRREEELQYKQTDDRENSRLVATEDPAKP